MGLGRVLNVVRKSESTLRFRVHLPLVRRKSSALAFKWIEKLDRFLHVARSRMSPMEDAQINMFPSISLTALLLLTSLGVLEYRV